MKETDDKYYNLWFASKAFATKYVAILIVSLLVSAFSNSTYADDEPPVDEVSVFLTLSGFGGEEIPALIVGETSYLSISDLFDYLKIRNKLSSQMDSVTGFFLSPDIPYVIDKSNNTIAYRGRSFSLGPRDLLLTPTGLYLKSTIFGKVFGLNCVFNFRSLSVTLNTKAELPAIREKRLEQMRANLHHLKGEIKPDTVVQHRYPMFNFGAADWSVTSTQHEGGVNNTALSFNLGSIIAGGESTVSLNHSTERSFNLSQQYYQWRFVNNERKALRQIMVGKILSHTTASIYGPIVGVQISNTPTTLRRSFDTYTLNNHTEPGWTVELYVNNVLLDYVKADASGFYTFNIPLVYGNSVVTLKFYGPHGEERLEERNINLPYNFLPSKEMEYTLSAGMVEDGKQSRSSRLDLKYGLSPRVTVGGGVEYLSSLPSVNLLPFANSSFRLGSNLLFSADYTLGVRGKGILSYRLPSDLMIELNYSAYHKGQQAINLSYLEERKASISIPFSGKNFSLFSKASLNEIVYSSKIKQTRAELLFSGIIGGLNANLTTWALLTSPGYSNIYSDLSLAFRLPWNIMFRPQLQYEYRSRNINLVKFEIENQISRHGYLNASYQKNLRSGINSLDIGLRFDLSFARTSFSARKSNHRTTFAQSVRGSVLYDKKTKYLNFNNKNNVGKGGLIVYSFLDLNSNNKRDQAEPKIQGLRFKKSIGKTYLNDRDSTMHIDHLQPYTSYLLEVDPASFNNIAWQVKNRIIKVFIEPNHQKLLEIPVSVAAEASGMVYLNKSGSRQGLGHVWVCFYNTKGRLVARTLTESDGYFSYLGLSPGSYTARIDSSQLNILQMVSSAPLSFTVLSTEEGSVIEGLEFNVSEEEKKMNNDLLADKDDIHKEMKKTVNSTAELLENSRPAHFSKGRENNRTASGTLTSPVNQKDKANVLSDKKVFSPDISRVVTTDVVKPPSIPIAKEGVPNIRFAIIMGPFDYHSHALTMKKRLSEILSKELPIVCQGDYYGILVSEYEDHNTAQQVVNELKLKAFSNLQIIRFQKTTAKSFR